MKQGTARHHETPVAFDLEGGLGFLMISLLHKLHEKKKIKAVCVFFPFKQNVGSSFLTQRQEN